MKRFKMTSACKHVPICQSAALSRMIMPTSPLTPWLRGCSCCPNLLAQASATWGFAYAAQLSVMIVYKWCFLKAVVPVAHLIKKLFESPMLGWRLVASLAGWLARLLDFLWFLGGRRPLCLVAGKNNSYSVCRLCKISKLYKIHCK